MVIKSNTRATHNTKKAQQNPTTRPLTTKTRNTHEAFPVKETKEINVCKIEKIALFISNKIFE